MDIDDFLLHDIKNAIQEADKNCFFFQASPENTKAIDLLDNIKRTRDLLKDNKTIVVYHDDNLERLTKINKKIVDI